MSGSGHVRLDALGGAQGVRGGSAAATGHQDADHTPVVAGRAATAFPRCSVGGLPTNAVPA